MHAPWSSVRTMPASRNTTVVFRLNVAVKLALVGLLVFGAFSGLLQFEGKAFLWRLLTYPVASLVVPVVWVARYRTDHRIPTPQTSC